MEAGPLFKGVLKANGIFLFNQGESNQIESKCKMLGWCSPKAS